MRLLSPNAARLIATFLASPAGRFYGYELLQASGMKSGSLYPVLGRFEDYGWITGEMQESPGGRPPRRVYILDPTGADAARAEVDRYLEKKQLASTELRPLVI